jgi:hypothetical protein
MRTVATILLAIALAAGATLSRPTEDSFKSYYRQTQSQSREGKNIFAKLIGKIKTDSYLGHCTYKDRFLWADIERDGKPVYSGAFNHWFPRPQVER